MSVSPLLLALIVGGRVSGYYHDSVRLPNESVGIAGIVRTLISALDHVDILALGEAHERQPDSDLRIALVRNADFPKKVRFIVVEFASTTEQSTLNRYIRGEDVSRTELEKVWKTTTQAANGVWDHPIYAEFLKAVRDVNLKLPTNRRITVLGGDPGPGDDRSREVAAVDVLKRNVLRKHAKALVIYGAAHFYRNAPRVYLSTMGKDVGIVRMLERDYPNRTLAVIPTGYRWPFPPKIFNPDYGKFDRALMSRARPVLVSLRRMPFRDFFAEEFGGPLLNARGPGGPVSIFKGSKLTLGQLADACVYFGNDK
jgi:hypothetical protein